MSTNLFRYFTSSKNLYILNNVITRANRCTPQFSTVNARIKANDEAHNLNTNVKSENEFLVKLKIKNDPDVFGSPTEEEQVPDEGDLKEEKYLEEKPPPQQKLTTKQYADIIKSFIHKQKIKEAIDVVEVRMLREDRVKPENYIFNLLIGACGRVGYTKKAFSLYNKMKKRGLQVTPGTYTALFNACANSPWPADGLSRASHLRNIMIEKMYEPNDTNYNAMIKAFGRCGDLKTAFALVDEMIAKRMRLTNDNLNFLLQSCISDKEAGFRHALLVWRRFLRKRVKPNVYSYNLLLRCVRDCGLGDVEVTQEAIGRVLNKENEVVENKQVGLQTEGEEEVGLVSRNEIVVDTRPNLLSKVPSMGSVISVSEIKKAEDRLLLLGGMSGVLEDMQENTCVPDIKTITQLLDCIPNTVAAEEQLLSVMKKLDVKSDGDFYNMLIKRRCLRNDFQSAREAFIMLKKGNRRPDLITYGVLALGCVNREDARGLVEEMQHAKYRLNTEILGALLYKATYSNNFAYVLDVMELCVKEDVNPSPRFMDLLVLFKKKCKKISNDKTHPLSHKTTFIEGYKQFRNRFQTFVQKVEVDDVENEHPWQQYRQPSETDAKHYKDKKAYYKPRHTSLFRQKTTVVDRKK